jgi:hypothetical protein
MRPRGFILFAALAFIVALCSILAAAPKEHMMLGPYDYEESGPKVPRFFLIDEVRCRTQAELKQAAAKLPPGSRLVWRQGDADPPSMIELGFPPMTILGFKNFCALHHVQFSVRIQR